MLQGKTAIVTGAAGNLGEVNMKTKYLAVFVILVLASSLALAETYQIQVRFTVRLRASYSLSSPIVDKALAGDVLQVVGRFNRWLKIERDGAIAWLADWVDYTRLDQQQAPSAAGAAADQQQRSNIDNCCFVDRQCASDQEWTDGYWAYQRNECPASPIPIPQSPVSQSPAPAIAEAPHHITNSQGRDIPIHGDAEFRLQIARGFYYMRDSIPQWWPYLSIIDDVKFESGRCTGNYACAGWPYKVLYFGDEARGTMPRYIASTLLHEACHLYQWQEGRGDNYDWSLGWEDRPHEIECRNKQREAGFFD